MEWSLILYEVFKICIIPLLGALTVYITTLVKQRTDELAKQAKSELADKYLERLNKTISDCLFATNQTYVNALKEEGRFDAEAQKIAFEKTYNAVLATLTTEAEGYLAEITKDLPQLITQKIEAQILQSKK